ncbi:MAG: hypothetical protein IJN90_01045 [Bacilli bacterium]|nr:hypothetical protein [Bacilli bacterium]
MKSILKILLGILEIAIIIFAIFMVATVFMRNEYGYTQFGDKTWIIIDDMNIAELPHYTSGDLVIIEKVLYNDVNVGDELYYYDTINEQYIVRSGIVKTKAGDNRSALYTFEGEKSTAVAGERLLGEYSSSHSNMGKILGFLQSTAGFLIFVILPILVLFIYQVYNLVMILKYDKE